MADLLVSLTYPPHLTLVFVVAAALVLLLRQRHLARALVVLGVGWSLLWSVPAWSEALRGSLERQYPQLDESGLPCADAIVVLGGGLHYGWMHREDVRADDLKSSRIAAGARAWLAGRAPRVILSGGGGGRHGSEAAMMAAAITRLGVPATRLLLETRSRSTEANAANTRRLAQPRGMRRVLLVTSALHMPRAVRQFRRQGFDVVPVPVQEYADRRGWRRWFPSSSALWRSGRALKEYAALAALSVQQAANQTPADWAHCPQQTGGTAFTRRHQAQP